MVKHIKFINSGCYLKVISMRLLRFYRWIDLFPRPVLFANATVRESAKTCIMYKFTILYYLHYEP